MTHPNSTAIRLSIVVLAGVGLLLGSGCSEESTDPASLAPTCGTGQIIQYDRNTGNKKCVDAPDGGALGDATIGATDAGATDTDSATGTGSDAKLTTDGSTPPKDTGGEEDTASACKVGATGLDKWWNCAPAVAHAGGKLHGESCTKDDECLYGACMFGLPAAGYDTAIGICTKNCKFGSGAAVPCYIDNVTSPDYECALEKSKSSGNDMRSDGRAAASKVFGACAKYCKSDADCQAWNPDLPTCIKNSTKYLSFGANGICAKNP